MYFEKGQRAKNVTKVESKICPSTLRNIIGQIFNSNKWYFCLRFLKIWFSLQKEEEFWKTAKEKLEKLDRFLTPKKGKCWTDFWLYHIYLCQRPHLVGTFLGFKMSKSRGREEKPTQKKAERRKKKKLGNMKTPHKFVGFSGHFCYKTREMNFLWIKGTHQVGSPPYLYECIYIAFRQVLGPPFSG